MAHTRKHVYDAGDKFLHYIIFPKMLKHDFNLYKDKSTGFLMCGMTCEI